MSAASLISPQSLNLYTYCGNDPINHTDPSGLFWGAIGRAFKNFFKRIIHAAVKAAVSAAVAFIVSGGNWGAAAGAFVKTFVASLGVSFSKDAFTPGWNPNVRHPLSAGSSLSKYIIKNFANNSSGSTAFSTIGAVANFLSKYTFSFGDDCPPVPTAPPGVSVDDNISAIESIKSGAYAGAGSSAERLAAFTTVALAFKGLVTHKGRWDYKRKGLQYENFGNFNYGATGAAAGLGLIELKSRAGEVQANPRDVNGNELPKPASWGEPWKTPPYGDQPEDSVQVEAGYNYFFKKKAGCK